MVMSGDESEWAFLGWGDFFRQGGWSRRQIRPRKSETGHSSARQIQIPISGPSCLTQSDQCPRLGWLIYEASWSGYLRSRLKGGTLHLCPSTCLQCSSFSVHSQNWKRKKRTEEGSMGEWEEQRLAHYQVREAAFGMVLQAWGGLRPALVPESKLWGLSQSSFHFAPSVYCIHVGE